MGGRKVLLEANRLHNQKEEEDDEDHNGKKKSIRRISQVTYALLAILLASVKQHESALDMSGKACL